MKTLYDFLFVDQEKMRSLYAQMYEGLLDVMVATDASAVAKTTDIKAGGDPVGGLGRSSTEGYSEEKQESMVPHDLVLRDVLAKLQVDQFILEDPSQAEIGNIVLLQGELALMDPNLNLVLLKAIPKLAADYVPQKGKGSRHNQEEKRNLKTFLSIIDAALEGFQPVVQFRIASGGHEAWGTIVQEHMRQPVNSLLMQYGQLIPGRWSMLGIVDRAACDDGQPTFQHPLPDSQAGVEDTLSAVRDIFKTPDNAICVTPLVIFRQLIGRKN